MKHHTINNIYNYFNSIVFVKKIFYTIILLFLSISLLYTNSSCANYKKLEDKFYEFVDRKGIGRLSYENVKFADVYELSSVGDTSGFCYFYLKFEEYPKNFFEQFAENTFSPKNSVFEQEIISYISSYFGRRYKGYKEEFKLDFQKEYYYSKTPIIYFKEDNSMIMLYNYSLDHGIDVTDNIYRRQYRTRYDYYKNFIIDSKLTSIEYENLSFFDSVIDLKPLEKKINHLTYEPEIAYFYFDLKENEKAVSQIIKAFEYKKISANSFYDEKKHEIELLNLKDEYKLFNYECYFSEYLCTESLCRNSEYAANSYIMYFEKQNVAIILYIDNYHLL